MRGSIRHHGVAVADAAGHDAIAGQRRRPLLRTDRVERGLVLVAGHRANLAGRAGLPHPPDLEPRVTPRSWRAGFAARARGAWRPLCTLHSLRTLRSGKAGLAAWTGRPLRSPRSLHARRALGSGRALRPLRSGVTRRTHRAGYARLTSSPARGAVGDNGLAVAGPRFERHGAVRRIIGEAKREAAVSIAAGGKAIVRGYLRARAFGLSRDEQRSGLDGGGAQADAGASAAVFALSTPLGFAQPCLVERGVLMAVLRIVAGQMAMRIFVQIFVVGERRLIGRQARYGDDERNQHNTHDHPSPRWRHLG